MYIGLNYNRDNLIFFKLEKIDSHSWFYKLYSLKIFLKYRKINKIKKSYTISKFKNHLVLSLTLDTSLYPLNSKFFTGFNSLQKERIPPPEAGLLYFWKNYPHVIVREDSLFSFFDSYPQTAYAVNQSSEIQVLVINDSHLHSQPPLWPTISTPTLLFHCPSLLHKEAVRFYILPSKSSVFGLCLEIPKITFSVFRDY